MSVLTPRRAPARRPARTGLIAFNGPFPDWEQTLVLIARDEYTSGRIDVDKFEQALEHIFAGGLGNQDFPYLPAFGMPAMERIQL